MQSWTEANWAYLGREVARLRSRLAEEEPDVPEAGPWEAEVPPSLEVLCGLFDLSPFERELLVLCAGVEIDPDFASLCRDLQGGRADARPTFETAAAWIADPDWNALAATGPLRLWRLIEPLRGERGIRAELRVDESVLQFLAGTPSLDARLEPYLAPVPPGAHLAPSHRELARSIAMTWREPGSAALPVLQLLGATPQTLRDVAAEACTHVDLALYRVSAQLLPVDPHEAEALRRVWEREAALHGAALLIECGDDALDAVRRDQLETLVAESGGAVLLASRDPREIHGRSCISFEIGPVPSPEQRVVWRQALAARGWRSTALTEELAAQFQLTPEKIDSICRHALPAREGEASELESDDAAQLWESVRTQARPRMENLAELVTSPASFDELVLPPGQLETLRELALHVRFRGRVFDDWGFAGGSRGGTGISALFAGPSGTGKTMAAQAVANALDLDLYRVDLSRVVSKYIGETEKNLRRVFDAAEGGGSVLLFDEADALFGKRSEVKDSHDRHANVEVSYLLQKMETYRGLALLTTNMKEAIDPAFLRRIRFVVRFPFPGEEQRGEIWRRVFPKEAPIQSLDFSRLAKLSISGGEIRNVAQYAAFLAANENEPISMRHLRRAASVEYAKLEKPLGRDEIGDWR